MTSPLRRLVRDERGANAVLLALLFVPILGFGAIALDVSAQHAELGQLQHGADAAVLAVASACAEDSVACVGPADAAADALLEGNGAIPVEGEATTVVDVANRTVTVTAEAEFPHFLASLIDGDGDPDHTTVSTEATAEWGFIGGGDFLPLAIAECELEHGVAAAGTTGTPFKLFIKDTATGPSPCDDADYTGGFSWLTDDDCNVTLTPDLVMAGNNGNNTGGTGCGTTFLRDLLGQTVLVALYDHETGLSGGGSSGEYTISKFAAFRITGYSVVFGGGSGAGATTEYIGAPYNASPYKFTGGQRGLQGFFVEYVSVADALLLTSEGSAGDPLVVRITIPPDE
ncbi:TadE/TadG family type IV pilus assembly protein [Agromyces ramosus]|nr:Tad domain-containing protein [Agromyces ramosus]